MSRLVLALIIAATLLTAAAAHARTEGGDLRWQDTFDLAAGEDRAAALAVDRGRVVVVGTASSGTGHRDFVVRATDARSGAGGDADIVVRAYDAR